MTPYANRLRRRREALLLRSDFERLRLRMHRRQLEEVVDGVDRGLAMVRRFATPPVLAVAGVAAALLLGAGHMKRTLASAIALLGLFLRVRSLRRILDPRDEDQAVRRSR